MTRIEIRRMLSGIVVAAAAIVSTGCFNPYACRPTDDAQGITFDGDQFVAYSYGAPPHINLQLDDTTTAMSQTFDANACGVQSGPKLSSRDQPGRFTWRSSSPAIVSVDSRGTMRGHAPGQARISVQAAGADDFSVLVDVVPRVAAVVISPQTATVTAGDTVRFDAFLVDASGQPIEFSFDFPYPVNLDPAEDQRQFVENWIPGNRTQLLKRFTSPGTYRLDAITVVRNLRHRDAAIVTVRE